MKHQLTNLNCRAILTLLQVWNCPTRSLAKHNILDELQCFSNTEQQNVIFSQYEVALGVAVMNDPNRVA